MPPLPPDVDLYIPVDLWIIRKTDSDHVWENELTRWSFTSAKNRFLWIKKKNSIKKKEKKNPSWANVNFFVSPFTSTVSQYIWVLFVLLCGQCLWAWCYSTIVNVKVGKTKIVAHKLGYYIYMDKKSCFIVLLTLL